jgi:hypothetical protein
VESRLVLDGVDTAARLASLSSWLRREGELRGRVRLVHRPPDPSQMGSIVEVITVAVGGSGTLTVLANALTVWLRQPRRPTVRISVIKPDGARIEITGEHLRDARDIEDLLRRCLHHETDQ